MMQIMAEQSKQQLSQAVAAARQQECVLHSQHVSAELQAHVTQIQDQHQTLLGQPVRTQIQAQHEAQLKALSEHHAEQQSTVQATHAAQLAAIEAEAERRRQSLEQVNMLCASYGSCVDFDKCVPSCKLAHLMLACFSNPIAFATAGLC